jgi:hypothetical protein
MSWHYLRVQEEESLQDVCSGGELLPPLKSKTIHAEFYCNGKLMDSYLDSLSGTTYEHSMESLGEEKSMSSQAVFHAKTLVPQEKESGLTESVQDSGEKWHGSFAKYDPATHSLRTPQCSLFEDSTEYCVTLPRWGSMRTGECWEQQMLEQNTNAKESGLWATPTTPSGGGNCGGSGAYKNALKNGTHIPHSINPNLYEWLMGWPIDWTKLDAVVTAKWPFAQQQHGNYSVKEFND